VYSAIKVIYKLDSSRLSISIVILAKPDLQVYSMTLTGYPEQLIFTVLNYEAVKC